MSDSSKMLIFMDYRDGRPGAIVYYKCYHIHGAKERKYMPLRSESLQVHSRAAEPLLFIRQQTTRRAETAVCANCVLQRPSAGEHPCGPGGAA